MLAACAVLEKLRVRVSTSLTALARATMPSPPPTEGQRRSNAPKRVALLAAPTLAATLAWWRLRVALREEGP